MAVGYDDKPKVSILDAETLVPLAEADMAGLTNGDLAIVSFSSDGAELVAGGRARRGFYGHPTVLLRRFDAAGRRIGDDLPVSDDTVHALASCADGVAVGTGDPSIGLVSREGGWRQLQHSVTVDMRDKLGEAFLTSADTRAVRFGLNAGGGHPALFDLSSGTLRAAPGPSPGLAAAIVTGLPVTGWRNTSTPAFAGTPIGLQDGEVSRSLAIRPDLGGFVLGTEWSLMAFDAKGHPRWTTDVAAPVWGVDFARDGKVLVAASGDGTLRWFRWSDGQNLLSLFIDAPTLRWVAWTPSGYYMASPGGEDLIGWQVNHGWDHDADFLAASRFRDTFARPDVVRAILRTLDESGAATRRSVDPEAGTDVVRPAAIVPPPVDGTHRHSDPEIR